MNIEFKIIDKKIDMIMDMVKWKKYHAKPRVYMYGLDHKTAKGLKKEVLEFLKTNGIIVNKMRYARYVGMMDYGGFILEDFEYSHDKFNVMVMSVTEE